MKAVKKDAVAIMDTEVQPLWFKILKIILLLALVSSLWIFAGPKWLGIIMIPLFITGIIVHFLYRYNTRVYTREWLGWKPPSAEGSRNIGWQYYTMIFSGWIILGLLAYLLFA